VNYARPNEIESVGAAIPSVECAAQGLSPHYEQDFSELLTIEGFGVTLRFVRGCGNVNDAAASVTPISPHEIRKHLLCKLARHLPNASFRFPASITWASACRSNAASGCETLRTVRLFRLFSLNRRLMSSRLERLFAPENAGHHRQARLGD